MEKRRHETFTTITRVVGQVLFLYGLLGWIYGVLVELTHPDWLATGLSHLTSWIRIDTFSIMSFVLSIVGFFLWRLTKELNQTRT
jgi:hypothetical protein